MSSTYSSRYLDNSDPSIVYSPPAAWEHHEKSTGVNGLTKWAGGTYSAVNTSWSGNGTVEVKIPVDGNYITVYSTNDRTYQGATFHCHLEYTTDWNETVTEGVWSWWSSALSVYTDTLMNQTLCSVTGLSTRTNHTLVVGVEADQVAQGFSIDLVSTGNYVEPSEARQWSSDFSSVVPPTDLRNTTASAALPSRTSSLSATSSSSSSSSSSKHSSPLGVGLGVALGVLALILGALYGFWHVRRKRAASSSRRRGGGGRLSIDTANNWVPSVIGGRISPFATSGAGREGGGWSVFGGGEGSPEEQSWSGKEGALGEEAKYHPALPLPYMTYDSHAVEAGSFFSAPCLDPPPSFPPPPPHNPSPFADGVDSANGGGGGGGRGVWEDLPRTAVLEDPSAFPARL